MLKNQSLLFMSKNKYVPIGKTKVVGGRVRLNHGLQHTPYVPEASETNQGSRLRLVNQRSNRKPLRLTI
jgi:hypothetical protein